MDLDPHITNWVLEFLLRQPLEERTLKSLLRAVHPPNDNPNLKKSLLLKKLEVDISRNSVTDATLDLLEQLEETELLLGNETISDTMKHAFCAVAVECTVKHLKAGKRFDFFEAVKSIWRGKVDVDKGGLGSEALWAWKDEIEAALWDDGASNRLVKKSEGINGVEAVNAYIREERKKMEPSFLELLAERVKTDEILQGIMGVEGNDPEAGNEALPSGVNGVAGESNANEGQLFSNGVSGECNAEREKTDESLQGIMEVEGNDPVAGNEAPPSGVNSVSSESNANEGQLFSNGVSGECNAERVKTDEIFQGTMGVEGNDLVAGNEAQPSGVNGVSGESNAERVKTDEILQGTMGVEGNDLVAGNEAPPSGVNGVSGESNAERVKTDEIVQGTMGVEGNDLVAGNEAPPSGVNGVSGESNAERVKTDEILQGTMGVEGNDLVAGNEAPPSGVNGVSGESNAERVKTDEILQGTMGVEGNDLVAGNEASPSGVNGVASGSNANEEMVKGKSKLRVKHFASKRSKRLASGNFRGTKIVDPDETTSGPAHKKFKVPCSAEVRKVMEALELSSLDLQAVVKDPLPDALKIAQTIADEARKHPVEDNQASTAGVAQAPVRNTSNASKPSLMERNSTARTCEWDESVDSEESIDGSQEGRASRSMARLPTPSRINTSPLNQYQIVKTRRKPQKWSLLEEDTLRTEVHRIGKGNWKVILNLHKDIFEGRTEGDLKDKWRNMTR